MKCQLLSPLPFLDLLFLTVFKKKLMHINKKKKR